MRLTLSVIGLSPPSKEWVDVRDAYNTLNDALVVLMDHDEVELPSKYSGVNIDTITNDDRMIEVSLDRMRYTGGVGDSEIIEIDVSDIPSFVTKLRITAKQST